MGCTGKLSGTPSGLIVQLDQVLDEFFPFFVSDVGPHLVRVGFDGEAKAMDIHHQIAIIGFLTDSFRKVANKTSPFEKAIHDFC